MRILAEADGNAAGERPACRLVAEALGVEIAITGLSADEMRYRLEGQGSPWRWLDLVERGPVTVRLATAPSHEPVEGEPTVYQNDLPDGHVTLVSGGEAQFRVGPEHADSGGILPYCFHAAVAQQLARAGVLTLHAAGIVTPHGGVLAIGRKGAGKSTLTASALCAGFGVVSDDWLLASLNGPGIRVERMRSFMMLRKGWASEQLRQHLPEGFLRESATRPRFHLHLPADEPRFPPHADIHVMAIVERPRASRREHSELTEMPPAETLAHVTESSMPVVFSHKLPVERDCLFTRLSLALSQVPLRRLQSGTELIDTPETAWQRLFGGLAVGPPQVDHSRSEC